MRSQFLLTAATALVLAAPATMAQETTTTTEGDQTGSSVDTEATTEIQQGDTTTQGAGQDAQVTQDAGQYCTEGFIQADSDNDGIITQDEVSQASDVEFSALDSDGDGVVTLSEFTECRMQSMQDMAADTTERGIQSFSGADTDGDGMISQQEYIAATSEASENLPSGGDGSEADAQAARSFIFLPSAQEDRMTTMGRDEFAARSYILFFSLDTEEPEGISQEEWERGAATRNDMEEILNTQYQALDTDQSGDITAEEYGAASQSRAESATQRAQEQGATDSTDSVGPPVVYYRYEHPM